MPRRNRFLVALAALAGSVGSAETPATEKPPRETDPRPGQHWKDANPEAGLREIQVLEGGREIRAWVLPPGGQLKILIGGENRLLMQARLQMESRTSPETPFAVLWTVDGGAEEKRDFRTKPHKSASFETGIGAVPGIKGDGVPGSKREAVVEIPTEGSHVVVFRLPAEATSPVVVRIRYEEPLRSGEGRFTTIGPKAQRDSWGMGSVSRLTIGYDDNVFLFSDADLHQFEEHKSNDPQDKYDRVASVGDFYVDSDLDVHIISPQVDLGRFYIGGTLKDRLYLANHRKSYHEYSLYFRHLISNSISWKVFGGWGPGKYYRDLNSSQDPGPQRSHAHHDDYEVGGLVRVKWAPQLKTGLKYTWRLRDWNGSFNEKDAKIHALDLDVIVSLAKFLEFELDLDGEIAESLASGGEEDASYRQFSPRLAVDVLIKRFSKSRSVRCGASYRFEYREYTTGHSRGRDPTHADRVDHRHRFEVYAAVQLGESTEIMLAYKRTKRTVNLPGRDSSTDPSDRDDDFEYTSNALELTLIFKFP